MKKCEGEGAIGHRGDTTGKGLYKLHEEKQARQFQRNHQINQQETEHRTYIAPSSVKMRIDSFKKEFRMRLAELLQVEMLGLDVSNTAFSA